MNKMVLITGASSGFGYEFAKIFAKNNYDLIIVARNLKKLEAVKIEFPNVKVTVIQKDLLGPNAVKELYREIKSQNLNIDILINNAGFGLLGKFHELDLQRQLDMVSLNISVLTELTHYVLQEMVSRNSGKILNVSSIAAFQPGPRMAIYFASKAYVLSFSEALSYELKDTNISVSTLCPGPAATNFGKVAASQNTKMFNNQMTAEEVAKIGYNSLMHNKRLTVAGKLNKALVCLSKFSPRNLTIKAAEYSTRE